MKLFNLIMISFLIGVTPFIISIDRGIELLDSVASEQALRPLAERQTPQFLDENSQSDNQTIISME